MFRLRGLVSKRRRCCPLWGDVSAVRQAVNIEAALPSVSVDSHHSEEKLCLAVCSQPTTLHLCYSVNSTSPSGPDLVQEVSSLQEKGAIGLVREVERNMGYDLFLDPQEGWVETPILDLGKLSKSLRKMPFSVLMQHWSLPKPNSLCM